MQITFDEKKKLDTNPIFGLFVQGENRAESIQIKGPKVLGALDLSQLRMAVRVTSPQYKTTVEKTLEQTADEDTITLTWNVDKQFTGSPGPVQVMLIGYGGNNEVIKITSSGITVKEDQTFGDAPPESTWEQILQQMQAFAAQAYESKTAAKISETNAKASETAAKTSETNAAGSASTASAKADDAGESASAAAASAAAAKTSETNAKASETAAKTSASAAKTSETNAANSKTAAAGSASAAENSASAAAVSQKVAEEKAAQATNAAGTAVAAAGTAAADAAAQAAAKTEQQIRQYADDRYARPLVTKTGPAASLEVYPDKQSNLKVYANGFTQQAGSGDPSPTNVRALTNGGLRYTRVVLDGTERVERAKRLSAVGGHYYQIRASKISTPVTNFNPPGNTTVCNKFALGNAHSTPGNVVISGNIAGDSIIRIGFADDPGSVSAVQALFQAAYESGDPYIVWVPQTTEGSLYAPIILQGGEYRATCLPLTAPLCDGDSVVSWVKSGCDKVVTFDGSEDEQITIEDTMSGGYVRAVVQASGMLGYTEPGSAFVTNWVPAANNYTDAFVHAYNSARRFYLFLPADDEQGVRNILSGRPLTVWYATANYTPAADIPVSLETHQQVYFELAVADMNGREDYPGWVINELASIVGKGVNGAVAGSKCNIVPDGQVYANTYADSSVFFMKRNIGNLTQSQFKLQYPDLVSQVVLPYKTPIAYAHSAVELPALPDDTGKVTITGQNGSTVTAVFNKSIVKEIAEIKAAMLAMGANLSM